MWILLGRIEELMLTLTPSTPINSSQDKMDVESADHQAAMRALQEDAAKDKV